MISPKRLSMLSRCVLGHIRTYSLIYLPLEHDEHHYTTVTLNFRDMFENLALTLPCLLQTTRIYRGFKLEILYIITTARLSHCPRANVLPAG